MRYPGRSSVLTTEIQINHSTQVAGASTTKKFKYVGIWDTGATNSAVTKRVIQDCGMKQIGMADVHGVGGLKKRVPTYSADIHLLNGVTFIGLRVTEADLIQGADALIGMDIIGQGDFAANCHDGKTSFTFRVPSCEEMDFTTQKPKGKPIKLPKATIVGRNEQCPCGSGKKFKNCCLGKKQ
jgi:hypothetical protein